MAVKLNFIPGTIAGSLTNFDFYRQLARRPLGEAFIYLAILIVIPALLFSGIQIYVLNNLMVEVIDSLEGHLPSDLRIDNGQVRMAEDTFLYEISNEYRAGDWEAFIAGLPGGDPEIKKAAPGMDRD